MSAVRKKSARAQISPPVPPPGKVGFEDVLEQLRLHNRPFDADFLTSAFEFTREMHADQTRRSGEPYYTHPLQVAYILAELRFDGTCVAVGLLHDVLEDTLTTRSTLTEKFGQEIAELVDGVTKIGRHEYVRRDQAQAETFRKLLLASAEDIR
ncbi:MAG: HD domain-containing protein, partial [Acidobacteria bacterium]